MNFESALRYLRKGYPIRRKSYKVGVELVKVHGDSYYGMSWSYNGDHSFSSWGNSINHHDINAEDWEVVKDKRTSIINTIKSMIKRWVYDI